MSKISLPVLLMVAMLTGCSNMDSTRVLDDQQTALLTRNVYHLKPVELPHVKKTVARTRS